MPEHYQWQKFYPDDWLTETALAGVSTATRAIWFDALCRMWRGGVASLSGTVQRLARLCRCTPEEMAVALAELGDSTDPVADVKHDPQTGIYTLTSRRLEREIEERERIRNAVQKHREAEKVKRKCNADVTDLKKNSNAFNISDSHRTHSACNMNVTPHAREEERREEKRREKDTNPDRSIPSLSGVATSPAASVSRTVRVDLFGVEHGHTVSTLPADPVAMTFQTVGEAKTWALCESHVAELSAAFPALDVLGESRKADAWINADPKRRKTPRGMKRFLFDWMSRATNRGGSQQRNGTGNTRQSPAAGLSQAREGHSSHEMPCTACSGSGTFGGNPCAYCGGTGKFDAERFMAASGYKSEGAK